MLVAPDLISESEGQCEHYLINLLKCLALLPDFHTVQIEDHCKEALVIARASLFSPSYPTSILTNIRQQTVNV